MRHPSGGWFQSTSTLPPVPPRAARAACCLLFNTVTDDNHTVVVLDFLPDTNYDFWIFVYTHCHDFWLWGLKVIVRKLCLFKAVVQNVVTILSVFILPQINILNANVQKATLILKKLIFLYIYIYISKMEALHSYNFTELFLSVSVSVDLLLFCGCFMEMVKGQFWYFEHWGPFLGCLYELEWLTPIFLLEDSLHVDRKRKWGLFTFGSSLFARFSVSTRMTTSPSFRFPSKMCLPTEINGFTKCPKNTTQTVFRYDTWFVTSTHTTNHSVSCTFLKTEKEKENLF